MNVDSGRTGRHILITGLPGVGKTTLIASVAAGLPGKKTGFLTREIRAGGVRTGFSIETLDGKRAMLAEAAPHGTPRVGKYRVLSESIRDVAVPAVLGRADFVVIDEIGKMECTSGDFVRAVSTALDGHSVVIATIAAAGGRVIEAIKERPDVLVFEVTRENRDNLAAVILRNVPASITDDIDRVHRPGKSKAAPDR